VLAVAAQAKAGGGNGLHVAEGFFTLVVVDDREELQFVHGFAFGFACLELLEYGQLPVIGGVGGVAKLEAGPSDQHFLFLAEIGGDLGGFFVADRDAVDRATALDGLLQSVLQQGPEHLHRVPAGSDFRRYVVGGLSRQGGADGQRRTEN